MHLSSLVDRIGGEGAAAWDIHSAALAEKAAGRDVVVMSVGDPDLATPDSIVDTAVARLRGGDTHYTEVVGETDLRAAVARHFRDTGGWAAGAENVCIVAGAQNGLFAASLLLLEAGDEVVALDPMYVTYEATVRASGAALIGVPPLAGSGFRPDPAAVEAAITPRTKALFLTNPNNPTGVVMTDAELEALADIARRHDLWVISDEVYGALTFDAPHRPVAALPGMADRTVTVSSLSKSHAMTGWRAGWIIGPKALIDHAEKLALCMLYGLPGFVQAAAVTALEQADAILPAMRETYRRRRAIVCDVLGDVPGLTLIEPQAGMFAMADVSSFGLPTTDFAWRLLREAGVSVLDGAAFGPSAAGTIRLSYTLGEDDVRKGCERIAAFCGDLAAAAAPARRAAP